MPSFFSQRVGRTAGEASEWEDMEREEQLAFWREEEERPGAADIGFSRSLVIFFVICLSFVPHLLAVSEREASS